MIQIITSKLQSILFFFFLFSHTLPLPSQKATLLLIPYHFTISSTSKNSIFIKILLFNLSLLFFSIRYFFLGVIPFLGLSNRFFFSQAPSTSSTNHKHNKLNPRCISLPPSTTTLSLNRIFFPQSPSTSSTNHKHEQTQTHAVSVSLPQPQPHQSETQTHADQKPTPSNNQTNKATSQKPTPLI